MNNNTQHFSSSFEFNKNNFQEIFSDSNIGSVRPGHGLPPHYYKEIIGRRAKENITAGTPLNWNMIVK